MRARFWIAIHVLVALLPLVGMLVRSPDVRLFGMEKPPPVPSPTRRGWHDEELQPAFQSWFEANVAFRGVMVRTDNTLQNVVLSEMKPGDHVVLGKGRQPFYVDDLVFMGRRPEDLPAIVARYDRLTTALGSVRRKLMARGKNLVVTVSPSKTQLYPENVPAPWRRAEQRSDVALHGALRAALERNGVPFADGAAILTSVPASERELMWLPEARHWSMVGACRVLREALVDTPAQPECAYVWRPIDRDANDDYDLGRLHNIWRVGRQRFSSPLVLPPADRAPAEVAGRPRPRTLLVGTSFLWMLLHVMRPYVDAPVALFYNRAAFDAEHYRELGAVTEDRAEWADWVLNRDLYIIDIFETLADEDWLSDFAEALDRRLGD